MSRKSVEKMCCVCLSTALKLNYLTVEDGNKITLHMKLQMCVSEIKWLASYQICEECVKLLDISYTFRKTCFKSKLIRHLQEKQVAKEECDEIRDVAKDHLLDDIPYQLDSREADLECIKKECDEIRDVDDQVLNDIPNKLGSREEVKLEGIKSKAESVDEDNYELNYDPDYITYYDNNEFKLDEEECDGNRDGVEDQVLNDIPYKLDSTEGELGDIEIKEEALIYEPNSEDEADYVTSPDIQQFEDTGNIPKKLRKSNFTCEKCDNTYKTSTQLVDHCITKHGTKKFDVRPFICDRCPSKFFTSSDLLGHIKCHEAVRSNICTYCEKGFITITDLKTHEKQHLNKCKFKCEDCGKCFSAPRNIRLHKMVMHSDPKSWKYCCEICNKRFPIEANFDRHVKTHSDNKKFECHLCQRKFTHKCFLQTHMKIHSDVREYKCTHCEREYKDVQNLKNHMVKCHDIGVDQIKIPSKGEELTRHLNANPDERPHDCPVCGRKFSHKAYVKRHLRRIHNTKKIPHNTSQAPMIVKKNTD